MQKANKITFLVMFAIATALCSVGCRQSFIETQMSIIEDRPATLTLNIDQGRFSSVATRATDDESKINSLALFVFNSKGKLLTRTLFDDAQSSSINVRTFSGTGMRVVAVANYKAITGLEEQLTQAANYDVLTDVVVTQSATSPGSSAGILMTGETVADITDSPSGTQVSLTMQFAVAKVTLAIKVNAAALPADESLEIFNLSVASIATRGHLFADNAEADDRGYVALESVAYDGNQDDGMTATFYVLENVRGGRKQIAPPAGIVENTGNGHLFKRHFAPDNSSYAVISANHRKEGHRLKRVDMYIYFGHNNSNNYNVARSENHTYSIRINGLNNVNIDTNVETTDYTFNLGYGDNLNFDAHADNRLLTFSKSAGVIDVEVVDNSGRRSSDAGFDATWVKLSPLDLLKHQVRSQKGNGAKGKWQQAGDQYSIVRGKYIPHQSWRQQLATTGGWNDVPKGKENDDQLSFAEATYRMCYAITDINLVAAREISIYADENMSKATRSAKIEVRFSDGSGDVQIQTLDITQAAIHSIGVSGGYEMFVESFEENTFNIYPSPAKQLTKNTGMHWGYYNNLINPSNEDRGDFLTANAVYGLGENRWVKGDAKYIQYNGQGLPSWASSITYRTKYGANSLTYNGTESITAPYYYPNYEASVQTYAPIYNSSAARYCHEKNRDVNGDGVIAPGEAHWFLPSVSEMKVYSAAMDKLPASARPDMSRGAFYWTSSEDNKADIAYMYDFSAEEEFADKKTTANRVRCMRRGAKVAQQDVYVDASNSIIVDNTSLDPDMITSTAKPLVPASVQSDTKLASKFIVGKSDAGQKVTWTFAAGMTDNLMPLQIGDNLWSNRASGCAVYSELADGSDKGKWRLPTLGELKRIHVLQPKLNAVSLFTPMAADWYWSVTEEPNVSAYGSWVVSFRMDMQKSEARQALYYARCIRQI